MKTSLIVLNLTIAGLLQNEVAAAEEATTSSSDEPLNRTSTHEPRFRIGIEQTVATFQRMTFPEQDWSQESLVWGTGPTDFTFDARLIDRLGVGIAAGATVTRVHEEYAYRQPGINALFAGELTITRYSFRANPRITYDLPLGSTVSLVPRMGIQYVYEPTRVSTPSFDEAGRRQFVSLTPGLVIDWRPVSWFFVGTGAELDYRFHSAFERDPETAYVEPLSSRWSLEWLVMAGARI